MSQTLAPYAFPQALDNNGLVLAGGLLYTYTAGTSTPATTYSNSTGTPNTNPIVLNSAGRYVVFLDATSYKFILTDLNGVTLVTQDNISAVNAGASGLGAIFSFGSNSSSPITATTYAAGATFDKLQPGTAVFSEDSANLVGTYKLRITGMMEAAGTLTVALMNLSDGAPDTPLATATLTSLTGAVATSAAIVFGASGSTKQYGIKTIVSASTGFLIGAALIRTA